MLVDCGWVEEGESDEGSVEQRGENSGGYLRYSFGDRFEWLKRFVKLMVELS